jgi:two-component system sensor histidine kinase TctE
VQARQAFIDNTAHQLRTPLAVLTAQAELLQHEPMPAAAAERTREVADAAKRLSRQVHQMLSLARAEEDNSSPVPMAVVSLPDVLQEVASACLDESLARDVDLGFEPFEATVMGSSWMLRELLLNLVENAIVHTPRRTTVTVRCGHDGDAGAYMEVEDDGPGIPPADRERAFDRFARLGDQDRRGTGLGLPIVREIAHRHGAEVSLLDACSGTGLRVRISFPNKT